MKARGAGHVGWRVHLHHGCRVVLFLYFFLFSNSVGAAQGLCGRVTILVRIPRERRALRRGTGRPEVGLWKREV